MEKLYLDLDSEQLGPKHVGPTEELHATKF